MSTASDRRAHDVSRIPFDGMVEVGGSLGPSFEAQAVNLSEEGMHLRTAYLPDVGQPLTCRFDAGQGMVVTAAGEVLWCDPQGEGGEFGIRFTNLDSASTVALQRIVGMLEEGLAVRPPQGRKIRLHIDGLASPMRARVRGAQGTCVTAFSELGFLQVGKQLALEDASTGDKRPALIDRVNIDIEPETRIPQLVVTLRYDDEEAHEAEAAAMDAPVAASVAREGSLAPHAMAAGEIDDSDEAPHQPEIDATGEAEHDSRGIVANAAPAEEDHDEESSKLKSAFARGAAKVGPALETWAKRAKTTAALLAARARAKRGGEVDDVEIPIRRTTAPPPGGGLHASGRKVVRGEIEERSFDPPKPRFEMTKKRAMVVGGAVGIASILALVAMRKPAPAPTANDTTTPTVAANALPAAPAPTTAAPTTPAATPVVTPVGPTGPNNDPQLAAAAALGVDPSAPVKPGKVTPFGNGPVRGGNVLKIKMDGPIGAIQGASQPSGFTVVIPGRKSLDAAGPLASKDGRIAAIRVSNEQNGAELTVSFKDGVPNYQVKARGDTLEMHLANAGRTGDKAPAAHAGGHKTKKKHR